MKKKWRKRVVKVWDQEKLRKRITRIRDEKHEEEVKIKKKTEV